MKGGMILQPHLELGRPVQFIDPLKVSCPNCGAEAEYAARDLLARRAACVRCGWILESVGEEMRTSMREVAAFWGLAEVAIKLEAEFSVQLSDELLGQVSTGEDLVAILAHAVRRDVHRESIRESVRRQIAVARQRETETSELHEELSVLFSPD